MATQPPDQSQDPTLTPYAQAYTAKEIAGITASQQAQGTAPYVDPNMVQAIQERAMTEEAMRRYQSHGYSPDAAEGMAYQFVNNYKDMQAIRDQEGMLALQEEKNKLEDRKKALNEGARYQEFNQKVNALPTTDLRRADKLAQLAIEYPDLAASPREEIRGGFESTMKNAHAISAINTARQSINAQKLGIPVSRIGGIPEEAINEKGSLDPEKGMAWANQFHSQEAEQEGKIYTMKEEAKYKTMLASKEAFQQFLIDSGIKLPKQQVVSEFERAKIARRAGLIPTGLDERGVMKYGVPRQTLPGEEPTTNPSEPSPEPEAPVQSQVLNDTNVAIQYLNSAGGDKEKAREMARRDGYTF